MMGSKMTITCDDNRRILALSFDSPKTTDRTLFVKVNANLNGIIVADAGYVSQDLENIMNTDTRRCLIKPRANMKKLAEFWQLERHNRRLRIEFDVCSLKMFPGRVSSLPRSVEGYVNNYLFSRLSFVLVSQTRSHCDNFSPTPCDMCRYHTPSLS